MNSVSLTLAGLCKAEERILAKTQPRFRQLMQLIKDADLSQEAWRNVTPQLAIEIYDM